MKRVHTIRKIDLRRAARSAMMVLGKRVPANRLTSPSLAAQPTYGASESAIVISKYVANGASGFAIAIYVANVSVYLLLVTHLGRAITVKPRNTGREATNKSLLLLADFRYCQ